MIKNENSITNWKVKIFPKQMQLLRNHMPAGNEISTRTQFTELINSIPELSNDASFMIVFNAMTERDLLDLKIQIEIFRPNKPNRATRRNLEKQKNPIKQKIK